MKTMKLIRTGLLMVAVAAFALNGCKKDKTDDKVDTTRMQQTSVDNRLMNAAVDDIAKDADKVMNNGNKSMEWIPCNATLDSTFTIADTVVYVIVYNGLNCHGNLYRQGTAEVHKNINDHWKDAGTKVFVKFLNLKVTKVATGKYAYINGTKSYTNVSGGCLAQLGTTLTSITHRVEGALTATFDDGSQRVWNVRRSKTFTGTPGSLLCNWDGLGTADGYSSLEAWGVNRHGDSFYNQITTTVVTSEACGWDPISGTGVISIPAQTITATLTFGYDDNNQLVSGGNCPTRYKVDWVKGSNSGTLFLSL